MKTQLASDGGELLPQNFDTNPCVGGPTTRCFLAGKTIIVTLSMVLLLNAKPISGDERVNEQPNLAVMHTLFVREHNRIARELSRMNRAWSDERIFQESRRIVNAIWQHIVYNEWLPIILGKQFLQRFGLLTLTSGFSNDYRTDFDPRITNAFAAAAFRFGHSLIPGLIQ